MLNLVNVLAGSCLDIPVDAARIASITRVIFRIIQIAVPLLLIIWGMLDLGKAVVAQKDDEIKKGQQTFIKRIVAAAIVFFVVTIVSLVINLISTDSNTMGCARCFIDDSECTWKDNKREQ